MALSSLTLLFEAAWLVPLKATVSREMSRLPANPTCPWGLIVPGVALVFGVSWTLGPLLSRSAASPVHYMDSLRASLERILSLAIFMVPEALLDIDVAPKLNEREIPLHVFQRMLKLLPRR